MATHVSPLSLSPFLFKGPLVSLSFVFFRQRLFTRFVVRALTADILRVRFGR